MSEKDYAFTNLLRRCTVRVGGDRRVNVAVSKGVTVAVVVDETVACIRWCSGKSLEIFEVQRTRFVIPFA